MDSLLLWIVGFSVLGGALSVLAASVFLMLPSHIRMKAIPSLVSFAIGSMLGAAFLGILPHALTSPYVKDPHEIFIVVLFGLLTFFLLEKLVLWRHCHSANCEAHGEEHSHSHRSAANLILIGDGVHNMLDGVVIAAAFMTNINLGIVTSLAIIAHEIPQEVGDFAILLHGGFNRRRALFYNLLSSLTSIIGGVSAYFFLSQTSHIIPYLLAVAASSFIYIAVADLIPGLHKKVDVSTTIQQIVLILAGILLIWVTHARMH
jgi:zinc and cadmium transporter